MMGRDAFHKTHGMGMHVHRALFHKCDFVRVRWRSLLGVVTCVGDTCVKYRATYLYINEGLFTPAKVAAITCRQKTQFRVVLICLFSASMT